MKPGLLMLPSAVSDSRVHNILPNKIDTDFQFSRASAATRVNHQGLIEEVGYFGPELVQNGDFSELGSELITNGDFATDSNWTINDWTISNGKLNGNSSTGIVFQSSIGTVVGKTYKVTLDITDYVSGSIRLKVGGSSYQNISSSVGAKEFYFVAANTDNNILFSVISSFTGSIDNVSVKQVDPNDRWEIGTDWSYGNNKVIGNSTQAEVTQQNVDLTDLKKFKTTFTVEDYVSGTVRIRFRGGTTVNGTPRSANGTYTEILTSTGHTNVKMDGGTSFTGSVTNVSVVEVIGDKPRLNYDPTNLTCPHLLLEPQSTNLVTFSEDFSQSNWNTGTSRSYILTETNNINPKGLALSYKFESTAGDNQFAYVNFTTIGVTITNSIYVKRVSGTGVVKLRDVNNIATDFNLSIADGWKRISVTATATSTTARFYLNLGDIGDEILIFGAQQEVLSYATSYIPTAGTAETRVAETCNSAGNVNTFNNAEGVIYAEIAALVATSPLSQYITISDRTYNNRASILFSNGATNQIRCFLRVGGVSQVDVSDNVTDVTAFNKIAFSYKANDFKVYINGSLVSSDTSGSVWPAGTIDTLSFSEINTNTGRLNARVKSLATYKRALTDTELYTITSTQYSAYSGMVAALGNYTIPC